MSKYSVTDTLANIQSDLSSRDRTIELLRQQIDELLKEKQSPKKIATAGWVSNIEQQFNHLQKERSQVEAENIELKRALVVKEEVIQKLEKMAQMQEEKAKTLNDALESRTRELAALRKEFEKSLSEKTDFRQAESQVIRQLRSQIQDQAAVIRSKENALHIGDGKMHQLRQKIASLESNIGEFESYSGGMQRLRTELKNCKLKLETKEIELRRKEKEIAKLISNSRRETPHIPNKKASTTHQNIPSSPMSGIRHDISKLETRAAQLRLDLGRAKDSEAESIARMLASTLSELSKKKQLINAFSHSASFDGKDSGDTNSNSAPHQLKHSSQGFQGIDAETKALISKSFKHNARRDYTDANRKIAQNLASYKAKHPNFRQNAQHSSRYTTPPPQIFRSSAPTPPGPTPAPQLKSNDIPFSTPSRKHKATLEHFSSIRTEVKQLIGETLKEYAEEKRPLERPSESDFSSDAALIDPVQKSKLFGQLQRHRKLVEQLEDKLQKTRHNFTEKVQLQSKYPASRFDLLRPSRQQIGRFRVRQRRNSEDSLNRRYIFNRYSKSQVRHKRRRSSLPSPLERIERKFVDMRILE